MSESVRVGSTVDCVSVIKLELASELDVEEDVIRLSVSLGDSDSESLELVDELESESDEEEVLAVLVEESDSDEVLVLVDEEVDSGSVVRVSSLSLSSSSEVPVRCSSKVSQGQHQ